MKQLTEIRWHARGGQGAVTAAKLLAEAALAQGQYIQAFPEYGPERMGAPIQAFTRLSNNPILIKSGIINPDIVIVLDQTLLNTIDVTVGLAANGLLIINSEKTPPEIRENLSISDLKIATVDATKIALETIGKPIPNTPMLGALIKATKIMTLEQLISHVQESFSKKFTKEIIQGNVRAIKQAYEEVKMG